MPFIVEHKSLSKLDDVHEIIDWKQIETTFGHLYSSKRGAPDYQRRYKTKGARQVRRSILWHIEAYYNRVRQHSGINYKQPIDFEYQAQKALRFLREADRMTERISKQAITFYNTLTLIILLT